MSGNARMVAVRHLITRDDIAKMRAMIAALARGEQADIVNEVKLVNTQLDDLLGYLKHMEISFSSLPENFLDYAYAYDMDDGALQIEFPLWDHSGRQSDAWSYFKFEPTKDRDRIRLSHIREP